LSKKQGSGVATMLVNYALDELKTVYEVFSLVDGALIPTAESLKDYARKEGMAIVSDPEKDKNPNQLVTDIIELRAKYEKMLNYSFSKVTKEKMTQDPLFQKSVKEVFDEIVGQHKSFPEYLSLLIDKKN